MENKIMMPASYNVMSQEEMTYTDGGATALQAVLACLVPNYGYFHGITAAREYYKQDKDNWASNGWNAMVADSKKSVSNFFYNAGCTFWSAVTCVSLIGIPINLAIIAL